MESPILCCRLSVASLPVGSLGLLGHELRGEITLGEPRAWQ